jgi:hypothetical protein
MKFFSSSAERIMYLNLLLIHDYVQEENLYIYQILLWA